MEKDFINKNITIQNSDQYPLALRISAQFFSYVFHPLFIPLIAVWYLAFIHQGYFTGITLHEKILILIRVGYNTIIFPLVTLLLLKAVGFIKSIFLKTQRERIIPYVAAGFYYFWMYLVFKSQPEVPSIVTAFIFGVFLTSSIGLIVNSFYKISMHAMGVGALSGLLFIMVCIGSPYSIFLSATIVFLIAGLVCTSRLIVSDHYPFDIYTGFFFGILCQVIAALFIGYV